MPDKCLDCPAPSADMDGFIVSGPGGAPRSEGSGVSLPEGPFVREAPQTGHVVIMGTLGADGNPGALPDAPQVGWAYVAEDAGEYGGVYATEGDTVYCKSLNPTRWGVWQSDSDDSGRDLVGVSAEVSCAGWRTAEDAELLSTCCLRQDDASGTCYGPDSASVEGGVLTVVWKTRWEARWLDMDVRFASGEGHVRVDLSQIHSLDYWESQHGIHVFACPPGGCVWNFEDVRARAALESFSGEPDPSAPQYERIITASFRLEERPASSLDVYARAADGTSSKSSSPLPCLDAALVSAKADASCAGRIVPAESAKFYINFSTGDANYSEDIDARSGSFVLSGAHVDWAARNYSSNSYVRLSFFTGGIPRTLEMSYDDFADFFNGTRQPGYFISFNDESTTYGLVLAERTELTSEDEGGPDVLVRFQIVDAGDGPSMAVVAETLGGDVSVGVADVSCLVPSEATSSAAGLMSASDKTKLDGLSQYPRITYVSTVKTPSIGQTENRELDMELIGTGSSRLFLQAGRGIAVYGQQDGTQFGGADRVKVTFGVVPSEFCGDGIHVETLGTEGRGIISVPDYQGASASAAGVHGLVPVASSSETNHLLAGDGTWMRPATDAEIDAIFA